VRHFDFAFVNNRPALRWQVPLLVLGWGGWLVALMRWRLEVKAAIWRCVLSSALPLLLFWMLALPGLRVTARPLASGSFAGLERATAPPPPSVASAPADSQAPPRPASRTEVVPSSAKPSVAEPVTITRHKPMFEWVKRTWDGLHAVVFFALTVALLMLTGAGGVWRISVALALLVQGVEWLEYGSFSADDIVETMAAAIGIAVALWLWKRLRRPSSGAEVASPAF
jgi:hypothetical protein